MDLPTKKSSGLNGNDLLVDTNFLIYLLNGLPFIEPFLNKNYFISEITEMELLGVTNAAPEVLATRADLIRNCYLLGFNYQIKRLAIRIKQKQSIKLPDAIIAATAIHAGLPLVTADRSFAKIQELDLHLIKPN